MSKRKRKEKWMPKQFETLERSGETWRPQNKHITGEDLINNIRKIVMGIGVLNANCSPEPLLAIFLIN